MNKFTPNLETRKLGLKTIYACNDCVNKFIFISYNIFYIVYNVYNMPFKADEIIGR